MLEILIVVVLGWWGWWTVIETTNRVCLGRSGFEPSRPINLHTSYLALDNLNPVGFCEITKVNTILGSATDETSDAVRNAPGITTVEMARCGSWSFRAPIVTIHTLHLYPIHLIFNFYFKSSWRFQFALKGHCSNRGIFPLLSNQWRHYLVKCVDNCTLHHCPSCGRLSRVGGRTFIDDTWTS